MSEMDEAIRPDQQMIYLDAVAHEMTKYNPASWTALRHALNRALGDTWVILRKSELAAAARPTPDAEAMVSDTAETAIEAARELLLMLHLETMTGVTTETDAVRTLMTELDGAIFAWDAAQPEQDESRWQPIKKVEKMAFPYTDADFTDAFAPAERGHDETGGKP